MFDTQEEALLEQAKSKTKLDEYFQTKLSFPKQFNNDNQCIFKIKNTEIIIDEDLFYDVIKYKWHLKNGYALGYIGCKYINLSHFIMRYDGHDVIDHINNNLLIIENVI